MIGRFRDQGNEGLLVLEISKKKKKNFMNDLFFYCMPINPSSPPKKKEKKRKSHQALRFCQHEIDKGLE